MHCPDSTTRGLLVSPGPSLHPGQGSALQVAKHKVGQHPWTGEGRGGPQAHAFTCQGAARGGAGLAG